MAWDPHAHLSQGTKVLYVSKNLNFPLAKTCWTVRTRATLAVQTTTFPLEEGRKGEKIEKLGSGQTGSRVRCFATPAGRKQAGAGLGLPTLLPLAIALNESFHFADKTELTGLASC